MGIKKPALMGKYIRTYTSDFLKKLDEESSVFPIEDDEQILKHAIDRSRREEETVEKSMSIERKLENELQVYWDQKKKLEHTIAIAMDRLEKNRMQMLEKFDDAINQLEGLDVRINNGQIRLEKLVIYVSEPERMHDMTDDQKLFVYKMLKESYRKETEACEEFLRVAGAISDVLEYRERGVSYAKEKEGGRYREPVFRHEERKEIGMTESKINEGILGSIGTFFKSMWKRITSLMGSADEKVSAFEESLDQLEHSLESK